MDRGRLVVLYGINNLGKTTQAKNLVEKLAQNGITASYLKYPLYALEPTGPLLNGYLREGNPSALSGREFQMLMVLNRTQYDAALRERIIAGEWIVAEDYVGTGIAWGVGSGLELSFFEQLNNHLLKEDLGILFHGERFIDGREKNHRHESDDQLIESVRQEHDILGKRYGWSSVNAHQTREKVADDIWLIVAKKFQL